MAKTRGFSGGPEALLVIFPRATCLMSPGLRGLRQVTCMGQAHTDQRWARFSLPPVGGNIAYENVCDAKKLSDHG
jgi:hypothetical protein